MHETVSHVPKASHKQSVYPEKWNCKLNLFWGMISLPLFVGGSDRQSPKRWFRAHPTTLSASVGKAQTKLWFSPNCVKANSILWTENLIKHSLSLVKQQYTLETKDRASQMCKKESGGRSNKR
jgi:hypothetical protein